jgi:alcohol dehydrogenase
MLGAAHACANPLTAHYGITHGAAVALMLPHVIQFNTEVVGDLYRDLLDSPLHERIVALKTTAGLPHRLRDFQINRRELPQLAQEAANQWTAAFNPRPVGEMELLGLYEAAY